MTAEELVRARTALGLTPGELAAEIGQTEAVVMAWEAGRLRIPRSYGELIGWRAAVAERQSALAASGLPECDWVTRWSGTRAPLGAVARRAHFETLRRHSATCPACLARARFISERFPPLPEPPVPAVIRALRWAGARVRVLPVWLRPGAVLGASMLVVATIRAVMSVVSRPGEASWWLLVTVLVMAIIGVVLGLAGGITYAVVREPLTRLGRLGDYATGVLSVWASLAVALGVASLAPQNAAAAGTGGPTLLAVLGTVFGLLIGHSWFRRR